MNAFSKKAITGAAGALALAGALAASAVPAEARGGRGAAWAAGGLAAGLLGAAVVSHSYAAPVYARSCWREKRPVFNRYGDIVGYRSIRVCD